jgi:SAM-dependent methyltransferase
LKGKIESSLRTIGYHPECVSRADAELAETLDRFKRAGSPAGMKNEVWSLAYDATLMKEQYFPGRLEFLSRLITLLGEQPEANLAVAEDGCGTGVDLHVLNTLLGEKVSLTGIDINEASLAKARVRVPHATLIPDFNGDTYQVIYADYVSIDSNMIWEVRTRGERNFAALRSPGIVLHNSDIRQLELYLRLFGQKFSRILPPEFLAAVPPRGPDCYLCKFEKD